jgi:hypothetical protein
MSPTVQSSAVDRTEGALHRGRRRRVLAMGLATAAAAGGLSLGLGGVAGAASSPSSTLNAQANGVGKAFAQELKHFNCGKAETVLGRANKLNAKFAKRDANLNAHLATVQKAGKAKRVKFYQNRLKASQKQQARLMGKRFKAGEAKVAKLAQQKCHINPPATT